MIELRKGADEMIQGYSGYNPLLNNTLYGSGNVYAGRYTGNDNITMQDAGMNNGNNNKVNDDTGKECQTCKNRKYKDGSDENVSFKSATHMSPTQASTAVRGHEGEHVTNAYDKARQNNGEVVNASVRIFTSICPECGRTYVSGGVTNTTIKYSNESNPYMKDFKEKQGVTLKGNNYDAGI